MKKAVKMEYVGRSDGRMKTFGETTGREYDRNACVANVVRCERQWEEGKNLGRLLEENTMGTVGEF